MPLFLVVFTICIKWRMHLALYEGFLQWGSASQLIPIVSVVATYRNPSDYGPRRPASRVLNTLLIFPETFTELKRKWAANTSTVLALTKNKIVRILWTCASGFLLN